MFFFALKLPDGFDNLGMFLEHERRDGHVLQLVEQVEGSRHVRVVEAERLLHLVVDVRQALFKFEPRHLKKKKIRIILCRNNFRIFIAPAFILIKTYLCSTTIRC